MGYTKAIETDELHLPSDNAYYVKIKKRSAFGDQIAAQQAAFRFSQAGPVAASSGAEWSAGVLALAASMIVEWNLTDENDQPLPITIASIALLAPEDGQFLVTEVTNRATPRGVEQERPFELQPSNS